MDIARVAKSHFVFSWMHIDVDQIRCQLQEQNIYGMTAMKHYVTVGLANRMAYKLVANAAPIDVKKLLIHVAAIMLRQPNPTI